MSLKFWEGPKTREGQPLKVNKGTNRKGTSHYQHYNVGATIVAIGYDKRFSATVPWRGYYIVTTLLGVSKEELNAFTSVG